MGEQPVLGVDQYICSYILFGWPLYRPTSGCQLPTRGIVFMTNVRITTCSDQIELLYVFFFRGTTHTVCQLDSPAEITWKVTVNPQNKVIYQLCSWNHECILTNRLDWPALSHFARNYRQNRGHEIAQQLSMQLPWLTQLGTHTKKVPTTSNPSKHSTTPLHLCLIVWCFTLVQCIFSHCGQRCFSKSTKLIRYASLASSFLRWHAVTY